VHRCFSKPSVVDSHLESPTYHPCRSLRPTLIDHTRPPGIGLPGTTPHASRLVAKRDIPTALNVNDLTTRKRVHKRHLTAPTSGLVDFPHLAAFRVCASPVASIIMHLATPIVLAAVAVAPALAASVPNLVKIRRAGGSVGNVLAGAPSELQGLPTRTHVDSAGSVTNITVTPSNVVQCSTASISWTGATVSGHLLMHSLRLHVASRCTPLTPQDPVDLSIGVGGFYVGTTWITTLSSISGGSATWLVDRPSGEDLIFEIKDANGQVGYTQNVQVASSGDSSCLSSGSSTSSSWSSASATTDGSGSSSAADASATPDAACKCHMDRSVTKLTRSSRLPRTSLILHLSLVSPRLQTARNPSDVSAPPAPLAPHPDPPLNPPPPQRSPFPPPPPPQPPPPRHPRALVPRLLSPRQLPRARPAQRAGTSPLVAWGRYWGWQ
jgi:hypothetical protein